MSRLEAHYVQRGVIAALFFAAGEMHMRAEVLFAKRYMTEAYDRVRAQAMASAARDMLWTLRGVS